ncbi:MAG: biopolymer transporter ExbD [Kofleriaceae bacterium]
MALTAQQVRGKTRAAVRRREDQIEDEERESGELNLIPYLDIVTNLMLFLLASISAGLILVQINTTLPDKGPSAPDVTKPIPNPDDQPLNLVVSVTRDRASIWSITGLEGNVQQPKASFQRTGRDGEPCDGAYMCESNACDAATQRCKAGTDVPAPVFDYRGINAALFEIANRRYAGKARGPLTYQIRLMADGQIPYSTLVSLMGAMRCRMPDFGKNQERCLLPTEDEALKKSADPIDSIGFLYDTTRAPYDANRMALFHDVLFSTGFEGSK